MKHMMTESMSPQELLYLGGVYLQSGDLRKGLHLFKNRHQIKGTTYDEWNAMLKDKVHWNGEKLCSGQHLLIVFEQGYGDCIMWIRTLFSLKNLHLTIYLPVGFFKRLIPTLDMALKQISRSNCSLSITDTIPERVDCWVYLADVGTCLDYHKDDYRCSIPYLTATDKKIRIWKKTIEGQGKRVVAFNLMGMDNEKDKRRMPIKAFHAILESKSHLFINLNRNQQVKHENIIPRTRIDDEWAFSDSAAIMLVSDFVCTTDTSIVHLAGALGVRCYVFLIYDAEWRWFGKPGSSFWYPTVIKCRQQIPDDWSGPVKTVLHHMKS